MTKLSQAMEAAKRKELIDTYKDGYRVVTEALGGARGNELPMRRPPPASGAPATSSTTWPTAR